MNKARRDVLRGALQQIAGVQASVSAVCEKEEDCLDNYPENLHGTERYEQTEAAVDSLSDALDRLDEAKEHIQDAINK